MKFLPPVCILCICIIFSSSVSAIQYSADFVIDSIDTYNHIELGRPLSVGDRFQILYSINENDFYQGEYYYSESPGSKLLYGTGSAKGDLFIGSERYSLSSDTATLSTVYSLGYYFNAVTIFQEVDLAFFHNFAQWNGSSVINDDFTMLGRLGLSLYGKEQKATSDVFENMTWLYHSMLDGSMLSSFVSDETKIEFSLVVYDGDEWQGHIAIAGRLQENPSNRITFETTPVPDSTSSSSLLLLSGFSLYLACFKTHNKDRRARSRGSS